MASLDGCRRRCGGLLGLAGRVQCIASAITDLAIRAQTIGALELAHRVLQLGIVDGFIGGIVGRHLEPLAQQRDLRVLAAGHDDASRWYLDGERRILGCSRDDRRLFLERAAARFEQRLAQKLELLVCWMQRPQIGVGRVRGGEIGEHHLRIAQGRRLVDQLRDRHRIDAATARVASVLQDRCGHLDLGVGGGLGREPACDLRHLEVGGIKAPIAGLGQLLGSGFAFRRKTVGGNPDRRTDQLAIVGGERLDVVGVGALGGLRDALADRGDDRIGRRRRRDCRRASGRRRAGRGLGQRSGRSRRIGCGRRSGSGRRDGGILLGRIGRYLCGRRCSRSCRRRCRCWRGRSGRCFGRRGCGYRRRGGWRCLIGGLLLGRLSSRLLRLVLRRIGGSHLHGAELALGGALQRDLRPFFRTRRDVAHQRQCGGCRKQSSRLNNSRFPDHPSVSKSRRHTR